MLQMLKREIRRMIRGVVDEALSAHADSERFVISWERQRMALRSTAEYVNRHMANTKRLASREALLRFALTQTTVTGLFLEFGVATGATINLIGPLAPVRVFGFDSFEGLPESWGDYMPKGAFAQPAPNVHCNVELVVGYFDKTLPSFLANHEGQVAFLHIDCDLYSSTKTVFETLANRIVPGTVIVFDEYFNYPQWEEGEHKALSEFLIDRRLSYGYIGYTDSQQAAIKIGAQNA